MIKTLSTTLFLLVASSQTLADKCTKQIDGHLEGLNFIIDLPQSTTKSKNIARTKKTRIEALRKYKTDCEIKEFVPELKQTDTAIKRATEQFK